MKAIIILMALAVGLIVSILPASGYAARRGLAEPEKEWAESATYFAARVRMRVARYEAARAILQRAVKAWPTSDRIDEAYYWIAFCHERSGANEPAIAWYKAYLAQYPNHVWAAQAKRRLDVLEAQGL